MVYLCSWTSSFGNSDLIIVQVGNGKDDDKVMEYGICSDTMLKVKGLSWTSVFRKETDHSNSGLWWGYQAASMLKIGVMTFSHILKGNFCYEVLAFDLNLFQLLAHDYLNHRC
ncbi:hypothetical protein VNO80_30127 [Phaseolus coccineus]|uniref:Uncharacterized protein n=1 Tax=Phaseolus coccineus TaxID=3886 RepID=A0AAN9LCM5_PHACN